MCERVFFRLLVPSRFLLHAFPSSVEILCFPGRFSPRKNELLSFFAFSDLRLARLVRFSLIGFPPSCSRIPRLKLSSPASPAPPFFFNFFEKSGRVFRQVGIALSPCSFFFFMFLVLNPYDLSSQQQLPTTAMLASCVPLLYPDFFSYSEAVDFLLESLLPTFLPFFPFF